MVTEYDGELEELEENFFCEGKEFPKSEDVLYSVSTDIERCLEPAVIAANLIGKKLIGKDNLDYLCSHAGGRKSEKIRQILSWISMCGRKPEILLRFYAALEETGDRAPSHIQLARIIRLKAMQMCRKAPPYAISVTEGLSKRDKVQVVKKMAQLLPKSEVDRDTALKLGKDLGLSEVHQDMNDIGSIFLKWIEEKKECCTPEGMVKALVLTKGLGQYVSKIACPWNPPEVKEVLISCENQVLEVIKYLGFVEFDEEDCEAAVKIFLKKWKFPDCGGRHNSRILQSLKRLVIPECHEANVQEKMMISRLEKQGQGFYPAALPLPGKSWPMEMTPIGAFVYYQSASLPPLFQPPLALHHSTAEQDNQITTTSSSSPHVEEPEDKECEPAVPQTLDHTSTVEREDLNENSATDRNDPSSLHVAVMGGALANLQNLLKNRSVDVNARGRDLKTPLMLSCMETNIAFFELLLHYGANPNLKDKNGLACLHYKEVLGSKEMILHLYNSGAADFEIENNEHMTPLAMACSLRLEEATEVLIQTCKANITGSPSAELTPLSSAVRDGNEAIVNCIIRLDQNKKAINAKNKNGSTPLITACETKQTDIGIKLIEAGADLNARNKMGCTTAFVATLNQTIELLQLLIIQRADLNTPGTIFLQPPTSIPVTLTPLCIAAAIGNIDVVKLLARNADVNYVPRNSSRTPIWWATIKNQYHIVEYLLKLNETRKDLVALKPVFECVVNENRYNIGALLLSVLGGEEKVLHEASKQNDDPEIEGFINIVIDGVNAQIKEQRRLQSSSSVPDAQNQQEAFQNRLNEFVKYSVEAFMLGRPIHSVLADEVNIEGQNLQFFLDYFNGETQSNLFQRFINGPSKVIFDSRYFTGERLLQVLRDHGKPDFMADLPTALLFLSLRAPSIQAMHDALDGKEIMRNICGNRFMQEVEAQGLFNRNPIRTSAVYHNETQPDESSMSSWLRPSPTNQNVLHQHVGEQPATLHHRSHGHHHGQTQSSTPVDTPTAAVRIQQHSVQVQQQQASSPNTSSSMLSSTQNSLNYETSFVDSLPSDNIPPPTTYGTPNVLLPPGGEPLQSNTDTQNNEGGQLYDTDVRVVPATDDYPEIYIRRRRIQSLVQPGQLSNSMNLTDDQDTDKEMLFSDRCSESEDDYTSSSSMAKSDSNEASIANTDNFKELVAIFHQHQHTMSEMFQRQYELLSQIHETQRQTLSELQQQTEFMKKRSKKRQ